MPLKFPKGNYSKKRRSRAAKRNSITKKPEAILQSQAESVLDNYGIRYIRFPDSLWAKLNSGARDGGYWEAVKNFKGVHDVLILFTSGKFLSVEFKRDPKLDYSVAQKEFRDSVGIENCRLISDLDTFLAEIKPFCK